MRTGRFLWISGHHSTVYSACIRPVFNHIPALYNCTHHTWVSLWPWDMWPTVRVETLISMLTTVVSQLITRARSFKSRGRWDRFTMSETNTFYPRQSRNHITTSKMAEEETHIFLTRMVDSCPLRGQVRESKPSITSSETMTYRLRACQDLLLTGAWTTLQIT